MSKKKLLFVCVENSSRSQMAEAFARIHGGENVEAYSAGSRPSGIVSPKAIAAMRELWYDLAAHGSKSLDESLTRNTISSRQWGAVMCVRSSARNIVKTGKSPTRRICRLRNFEGFAIKSNKRFKLRCLKFSPLKLTKTLDTAY